VNGYVTIYAACAQAAARLVGVTTRNGNLSTLSSGLGLSEEWGRALAAAGYIVIHPSRVPVDDVAPFQAQCDAEGLAEEPQKQGKPLLGPLAGYRSLRTVGATTIVRKTLVFENKEVDRWELPWRRGRPTL
jgi:hypothetical protein